jgi:C4-dicarboxylate-specific signal transduction histidine kinase
VNLDIVAVEDGQVNCRPTQLSQVLLNLLSNAFDAVSALSEKWVRLTVTQEEQKLIIKVIDSGNGIPSDIAEKIMQPFFTTKVIGKGTGLGLSISRGIIESHEGALFYDPSEKNTTFVIELPIHKE